jgi:hypothetical protein
MSRSSTGGWAGDNARIREESTGLSRIGKKRKIDMFLPGKSFASW